MKHPPSEQWLDFLYGELPAAQHQQLQTHLDSCAECRCLIDSWRQSLHALETWKVSRPPSAKRPARFPSLVPWAAAAALVVFGLGLALGLLTAQQRQLNRLRTELRPVLEQEITQQLEAQWTTNLQTLRQQLLAELSQTVFAAAREDNLRLISQLAKSFETARAEDRQTTRAWLLQLEQQQQTSFIRLRQDLETVATEADDQLQSARRNLDHLLLLSQAVAANASDNPSLKNQ